MGERGRVVKRTWWDRWEDEMHFRPGSPSPAAGSPTLILAAMGSLLMISAVAVLIVADYARTGKLLDDHAQPVAVLILTMLASAAALFAVDERNP